MNDCENTSYTCDNCGKQSISELRFKCDTCENYDLCSKCYYKYRVLDKSNEIHDQSHSFTPMKKDGATKLVWGTMLPFLRTCGIKF
eukprot:gnl/Chilomastix_caulleri/2576.p1 GENE.gnl/Chilomastix_caulleri/2576~~gnl/Chilomastix_caulleri/2576.p1  ORF type:complete len:86 (+),score=6.13 gnl/Chilomastix_caulleri/2576:446-703(+)